MVPTEYFNGLVAAAAGRLPQPLSAADLADLWDSIWFLLLATADGKPSEDFSPLENEWDRQDQLRWFSRDDPPPLQQPELLKEALDLLKDNRFRTLRQHCLAGTTCPLLVEEEVTPYKLRQVWNTLKWYSKTFGMLKIDELHRLKSKKSSLEEALTDTVTGRSARRWSPAKEVIWALEEGAGYDHLGATGPGTQAAPGRSRHEVLDAFILGFARFQVGCSARFNDLQHVHPKDLIHTSNTVELKAWQTKKVSAARINRNPVPLIAPKYSFTGIPWWTTWVATVRRLVSEKAFQDMDYLLPTVSKDFAGLIPRPSAPERALRWLKDALLRRGVTLGLVKPLTWHSFQVFIPDCAFQMGLPRERRMYLGNWLTESTADVYVREKRNVVVEVWGQVAQKVPNLNLGPGRERREDLNHPGRTRSRRQQWKSRMRDRTATRTKLKGKGRRPPRYPQGAHRRLAHGHWWNRDPRTHQ